MGFHRVRGAHPDGHRYNSAIVVERDGTIVHRYRKVHLPGHEEPEGWRPFQHPSASTSSPATASTPTPGCSVV
ncbi:MAG: nitrilase-related carbon-nitrogen hydrolase [Acidimicrobiia bacterium]